MVEPVKSTPALTTRLADPDIERVRRNLETMISELKNKSRIVTKILPDNAETFVSHGLGRRPVMMAISPPRGAANAGGSIRDFGDKSPLTGAICDRSQSILLRTDGFGSQITVDIEFT